MHFTPAAATTILLALALAFSGCAGSGAPSPAPSTGPTHGDDTGAIEGILTDDELAPVRNAQVALQSGAAEPTTTDADGRFQFSQVPPGSHVLFATALGYESIAKKIDVAAGEATQVALRLSLLSPSMPFSATETKKGYIACGSGTGSTGVGGFTQVTCGDADPNQEFLFNYTFSKGLKGILFEMAWTPTQALSKDLVLIVEKDGCGFTCAEEDTYAQVQGCCALRIALTIDQLTKGEGELPETDFTDRDGTIQTRTFPGFGDNGAPTTVFTAQNFEIHVEYFYHELPADFDTRSNIPQA